MAALHSPKKLTVVVAPLNVVITGLEQRAAAVGLRVARWSAQCERELHRWMNAPHAGLLLVSADVATTHTFSCFLDKQFTHFQCLNRLFMDEVHLCLQDFRSVMLDLWRIRPRGCSWVFLTGSLAVEEEPLVSNIVDARPIILRPDTGGIGFGTARLNIEYIVRAWVYVYFVFQIWYIWIPNLIPSYILIHIPPQVLQVPVPSISLSAWPNIISAMDTMQLTGPAWAVEEGDPRLQRRGIIFTRSTARCDALYESVSTTWFVMQEADAGAEGAGEEGAGVEEEYAGVGVGAGVGGMRVVKYHSQMDEEARVKSFTTFTSNAPGLIVMVATTAAGVSLDHHRVRWTIHEGGVYGDNNMVQETGRAGRDGKPALSVILVDDETQPWMMMLEREARSSPNARLLHEEYPPIKAASIRRARQTLEYGIAGGKVLCSGCLSVWAFGVPVVRNCTWSLTPTTHP